MAARTKPTAKPASPKQAPRKALAKKTSPKKAPAKALAKKTPGAGGVAPRPRVFAIPFASVYPLYVQKAENKGRTKAEVDEIIAWLTGYRDKQLQRVLDTKTDLEAFFAQAPLMNPNAALITGVVCGVRVEEVADPLMRKIRYLDN
jgi:hypothetical protein